ncbi:hypothetical protein M405DRAFT_535465 [Rhizopogon salebrosus TDB-379]|nr:hypothetical protein M405DRAFT_535465 [Rhizopogon salebrosus TDB-379]
MSCSRSTRSTSPVKHSLSLLFIRCSTRPHALMMTIPSLSNQPPHNVQNLQSTSTYPTYHLISLHPRITTPISSWSVVAPSNAHHCPCISQAVRKSTHAPWHARTSHSSIVYVRKSTRRESQWR